MTKYRIIGENPYGRVQRIHDTPESAVKAANTLIYAKPADKRAAIATLSQGLCAKFVYGFCSVEIHPFEETA